MSAVLKATLRFIPDQIWGLLKKFVQREKYVAFDGAFKWSTKFTPALLVVMSFMAVANQLVRDIDLDCTTSDYTRGIWGRPPDELNLNDYCWTHETFIVEKALRPEMREYVTYPGISGYEKGRDEIVRQRYYKYVWLAIALVAVLMLAPLMLWKLRGTTKLKSLIELDPEPPSELSQVRAEHFLSTVGLNRGFALHYLGSKICATVTPILGWYFLCGFLGGRYKTYGIDVMYTFVDNSDPWPHPMDALFPKVAKCEWSRYGISGDREIKSAQCQLPMNNLTQWSFFVFWVWLAFIFVLNALSTLRLIILMFPPYRNWRVRSSMAILCREQINAEKVAANFNGKKKLEYFLKIHLKFEDWLILEFLKRNLIEWEFRALIQKMVAVPDNGVVEIRIPKKKNKFNNHKVYWNRFGGGGNGSGGGEFGPAGDSSSSTTITTSASASAQAQGQPHAHVGFRESLMRKAPGDDGEYDSTSKLLTPEHQHQPRPGNNYSQMGFVDPNRSRTASPEGTHPCTCHDQGQRQGQSPYPMGFKRPAPLPPQGHGQNRPEDFPMSFDVPDSAQQMRPDDYSMDIQKRRPAPLPPGGQNQNQPEDYPRGMGMGFRTPQGSAPPLTPQTQTCQGKIRSEDFIGFGNPQQNQGQGQPNTNFDPLSPAPPYESLAAPSYPGSPNPMGFKNPLASPQDKYPMGLPFVNPNPNPGETTNFTFDPHPFPRRNSKKNKFLPSLFKL